MANRLGHAILLSIVAKKKNHQTFEYREGDIEKAIDEIKHLDISEGLRSLIINCLKACLTINALLQRNKSLRRLIGRLFGFKIEKQDGQGNSSQSGNTTGKDKNGDGKKPGHGRRGYKDLENATEVHHSHPKLKKGDPCPEDDCDGRVYPLNNPGVYVRITANPPIETTVHLTEKFRCSLCSKIFEFVPEDIKNGEKYDEKVLAQVVMNKCFYGIPFERDAALGGLSASVRSDLFKEADKLLRGVFEIMVVVFISDDIVSFDDTKIKIQPLKKGGKKWGWASCFVSRKVVLFILNRSHAGICFKDLLKRRPEHLGKMVVLSDALPAYKGYKQDHIDAHCMTHGRRRFVEGNDEDPEYSQKMIGLIGQIYEVDSRGREMGDLERMELHKSESEPIFEELVEEAQKAVKDEKFIPESSLGKAVTYVSENSSKLRVFMEVPGVPLDTNHVEREIKCPIRIRKLAPVFKTDEGALRTGRILSIIETCRLNGISPWDYLCWAIKRAREGVPPEENTPWAFKRSLEKVQGSKVPHSEREGPSVEMPESEMQMATN